MALTPLLDTIRAAVRHEVVVPGLIELREDDASSTIPPVRLGTTEPTLVLRLDRVPHDGTTVNDRLYPLFQPDRAGLQHCDYVLLRQAHDPSGREEPLYVLLVELKSGRAAGATKQIMATRILLDAFFATLAHIEPSRALRAERRYRGLILTPSMRAPLVRAPDLHTLFQPVPEMQDLTVLHHPPCDGYDLRFFCR